MNKANKKRLNMIAGPVIAIFFVWIIGKQVADQMASGKLTNLSFHGSKGWLAAAIGLFAINISLEISKWHLLTLQVAKQPAGKIAASYFAGMALSMVTPNRVGEYPGRLLYLGIPNVYKYVNVALLGTLAQLLAVIVWAIPGLIANTGSLPHHGGWIVSAVNLALCLTFATIYWSYGKIRIPNSRWKPLAKAISYSRLVAAIPKASKVAVLAVSMLRFCVYSLQFVCMLKYFGIEVPTLTAFGVATTFFWAMTVIPSVALAELGIRGSVALFLLSPYSHNTVGILAATVALWFMNLVIPSLIGSALMAKMKLST